VLYVAWASYRPIVTVLTTTHLALNSVLPMLPKILVHSICLSYALSSSITTCSKGEADVYASLFLEQDWKASQCPDAPWMELMRDTDLARGKNDGIFINIGFNKGYNFATWGELFMPWSALDPGVWYRTMLENKLLSGPDKYPCGICNDCLAKMVKTNINFSALQADAKYLFTGLDLNEKNTELVSQINSFVRKKAGVDLDALTLHVIHGAGGNATNATIKFPACVQGKEDCR
jgi:hypothetical protein